MTNRQALLLRRAEEALAAAKDLSRLGYLADAASRAYYAMFYIAEAFLDDEGLTFSSHAAVESEFGRVFARTGRVPREFHRHLLDAREDRLEGDYGETFKVPEERVCGHLRNAERFLQLAEEMIGKPEGE